MKRSLSWRASVQPCVHVGFPPGDADSFGMAPSVVTGQRRQRQRFHPGLKPFVCVLNASLKLPFSNKIPN